MKNNLNFLFIVLFSNLIFSQVCEEISPYKEGAALEYTNYNKKGKETSVENHMVKSVKMEDGALSITLQSIIDKKTAETKEYVLKCINGNFLIDMSNYTSLQEQNGQSSLEVKANGSFLEFPNDMAKDTVLTDGTIDISIGSDNALSTVASMKVLNRKVLDKGPITTKAGTYDGYKVSFDYIFNIGILKFRGSGIEWYVKGIGIVKTESYSKNGKLRSTRELTKLVN